MGERADLILEKPENVLAELKDGDNWRYTAQCGVRPETHGQRPGGRMDVEIKVEQPIDPDHPYTITVAVHDLSEAVKQSPCSSRGSISYLDSETEKVPISQCQSSSSRPSQ